MADTTKLKTEVEPYVCQWLSGRFPGHVFRKRPVSLVTGATHEFDAVADDESVVGAVLCNRARTSTGNENTGGVRKAGNDVSYLRLLPHHVKKLMVCTDPGFCELIRRRTARLGVEDIDLIVCPLPPRLAKVVTDVLDQASREQRTR